jgi:predicted metalloprotease
MNSAGQYIQTHFMLGEEHQNIAVKDQHFWGSCAHATNGGNQMNIEMHHVQQQSAVTSLSVYCFLISQVSEGKALSTSSIWPVFLHNKKIARKEKSFRAMQMTIILNVEVHIMHVSTVGAAMHIQYVILQMHLHTVQTSYACCFFLITLCFSFYCPLSATLYICNSFARSLAEKLLPIKNIALAI